MEISIHIHEDDWGMRNLHPVTALPEASADVQEAAAAGVRNLAPDGVGWTDVHVIKPPSIDYSGAGLRLQDALRCLEPLMPRVRRFNSTASAGLDPGVHDAMGSYEQEACCFGFDESCFMKLDADGDRVKQIWFECRTQDAGQLAALREGMLAIDALVPSMIADYWNDMSGRVRDAAFLSEYFRELAESGE